MSDNIEDDEFFIFEQQETAKNESTKKSCNYFLNKRIVTIKC